ncbi:MAG: quinone oxidoreductase [Gammaproteobacteria bacterium]|jgi:NADPH2:quinone reductase|nr:quinone oxidoreductase [Gammaproteobacteria bacterium]MBT3860815.1 quinone oxidoreductase [Gammaproteobacteria bacterium]MBT3986930.1 quinone oxidoreductase [Gammaproteobacteria bacterium]MBT4256998.1 quinone oxidoreductase [Gammaproteobacteria bacterium]MBT4582089.1 quinone oxidoreductase [Gammaproteobacteria bacterium]
MKAVRVKEYGGPEAMCYEDIDVPSPGANDVLVKVEAAGINFIDTYQRSGLYQIPLPATLGLEAGGIVEEVGSDVSLFKAGDRVAYTNVAGAYAEYASVPEDKLVALPDGVSFAEGAAAMLQGCTAHYLSQSTYKIKSGDSCLIHAAAGGVGLLLIQMAKMAGASVIGTVSTEEKAELARAAGADEVILYSETDFETEVKRITDGKGVNVAYDSVGKTTFDKSIDCLQRLGYMVLYGNASGPVTEFNPATLGPKGSLFLTRPTLFDYVADRESLEWRSGDVFNWIAEGKLKLRVEHFFPLSEAEEAHRALEGRKTTGKVILTP